MLEAHIKVDKELAVRGFRKALKHKAFRDISFFYGLRLMVVWAVILLVDTLWGQRGLVTPHLAVLTILWLGVSIHGYRKWYVDLADNTDGWEFQAKLDDTGVTTQDVGNLSDEEVRREWDFYQSYRDYEDYLQIDDINGGITFLPKTPDLTEIVEFTKNKISRYGK